MHHSSQRDNLFCAIKGSSEKIPVVFFIGVWRSLTAGILADRMKRKNNVYSERSLIMSDHPHNYAYFSNRDCEYFPCHGDKDPEFFNCLFCYCPLYMMGENCGGNFRYYENGIKDCSNCMLPHSKAGYQYINGKFMQIVEQMSVERKKREQSQEVKKSEDQ